MLQRESMAASRECGVNPCMLPLDQLLLRAMPIADASDI